VTEDGKAREMDADAFFELPLTARVRHVLDGSVQFFRDGSVLDTRAYLSERQSSGRKR
jgi:hypothetical protein